MPSKDDVQEWKRFLGSLTAEALLATGRDYIWLAEFGPTEGRATFDWKRDGVVGEMTERGMLEELREVRRELAEREAREIR